MAGEVCPRWRRRKEIEGSLKPELLLVESPGRFVLFPIQDNDASQVMSSDCSDSWVSDGYCDDEYNTAECDWDGGDCCECDCVNDDYTCGYAGFDCLNPSSACGSGEGDDVSVGAIVGGVIGGLLLLVAVIVLVVLFKKGHLKPCVCGEPCACCEPGSPEPPAPAPAPAPAGVGSAPSVVQKYPEVYSSAAVAPPPPPAYEGPGNAQPPGFQAYAVPAATDAPPAYEGPVGNQ